MTQEAQVKVKMSDRVRLEVAHGEVISHQSYGGYSVSVNKVPLLCPDTNVRASNSNWQ